MFPFFLSRIFFFSLHGSRSSDASYAFHSVKKDSCKRNAIKIFLPLKMMRWKSSKASKEIDDKKILTRLDMRSEKWEGKAKGLKWNAAAFIRPFFEKVCMVANYTAAPIILIRDRKWICLIHRIWCIYECWRVFDMKYLLLCTVRVNLIMMGDEGGLDMWNGIGNDTRGNRIRKVLCASQEYGVHWSG